MIAAIIGSAGRREDSDRLNADLYSTIQQVATHFFLHHKVNTIVSGGAAWIDHLAVRMFLNRALGPQTRLVLHLPCAWAGSAFLDTGVFDWRANPGGTANALHRKFKKFAGIDSLAEIARALQHPLCSYTEGRGFHQRNGMVSTATMLLACTFGRGGIVKDGGTAHTCGLYKRRIQLAKVPDLSFHMDLSGEALDIYPAILP